MIGQLRDGQLDAMDFSVVINILSFVSQGLIGSFKYTYVSAVFSETSCTICTVVNMGSQLMFIEHGIRTRRVFAMRPLIGSQLPSM